MDQRLREEGISVRGSSGVSASPHAEEYALAPREIPRDSLSRDDVTPKARPWIKSGNASEQIQSFKNYKRDAHAYNSEARRRDLTGGQQPPPYRRG